MCALAGAAAHELPAVLPLPAQAALNHWLPNKHNVARQSPAHSIIPNQGGPAMLANTPLASIAPSCHT